MDWTVSSYPKDAIYTHQWTIEDFSKAMARNDGKIDGPPFRMPGLQESFFLCITQSQCDRKMTMTGDYDGYYGHANPEDELHVSHLFDVWLRLKNPSDDSKKLKLAGTLQLSQGSTDVRSRGHFIGIEEGVGPFFAESSGSAFASNHSAVASYNSDVVSIHPDGWQFSKERFRSFKKWGGTQLYLDPYDELPCADFYALDHTPELTLKATIKIPSSMVHSSGVVKSAEEERVPFKHLLQEPDFSDVTLKLGDREFRCHRLILANK